jgi:hypothetical protein
MFLFDRTRVRLSFRRWRGAKKAGEGGRARNAGLGPAPSFPSATCLTASPQTNSRKQKAEIQHRPPLTADRLPTRRSRSGVPPDYPGGYPIPRRARSDTPDRLTTGLKMGDGRLRLVAKAARTQSRLSIPFFKRTTDFSKSGNNESRKRKFKSADG